MSKRKNKRIFLRLAWYIFIFVFLGTLTYWFVFDPPRTQHKATKIMIQQQEPNKKAVDKRLDYGLTAYHQNTSQDTDKPSLYIIFHDIGLQKKLLDMAVKDFAPQITLSFSPYTPNLKKAMHSAWDAKHEVLLDTPLQSLGGHDKGPLMLRADHSSEKNLSLLSQILSKGSHFIGIVAADRSQINHSAEDLSPLLTQLKKEGMIYVDGSLSARSLSAILGKKTGTHIVQASTLLTPQMTPQILEEEFKHISDNLKSDKAVIVIASLSPLIANMLKVWLSQNATLFSLQPLSHLFNAG